MSSSSSSSSGTGARSLSRLPQPSSRVLAWGAAAVTAAALYALPPLALRVALGGTWSLAALAACVVVLLYAAVRLWSPLVVLALVVVAAFSVGVWWFIVVVGDTCGGSHAAAIVEWSGTGVVAVGFAAWQLPRGRAIFWAVPVGAVLAAVWFVVWAHVIPGGAAGCFH